MIGVPSSPGTVGWLLLAAGLSAAAALVILARRRLTEVDVVSALAAVSIVVTVCVTPYLAWRVVQDLRYTTALDSYSSSSAGPIQAYLPGYLADGAARFIPPAATYATAVGPTIPWAQARAAFPSLVMNTLFPRRSVASLTDADYVVTWGIRPVAVVPVSRTWIARPRSGLYPPVWVARVRH